MSPPIRPTRLAGAILACAILTGFPDPAHGAERRIDRTTKGLEPHESRVDLEHRARQRQQDVSSADVPTGFEVRSIDGSRNNGDHASWGRADSLLLRLTYADYADGIEAPAGDRRPNPRRVSNIVVAQTEPIPNEANASDFVWVWGQFLDHDLSLTPAIDPPEPFDIPVPRGDPYFDPHGTGTEVIPLDRSLHATRNGRREQLNVITTWIDASNVYGSDPELALRLRALDGSGRLRTSVGELLPYDPEDPTLFLAGDVRANENVALTAMHTLFVREHNYWADHFAAQMPQQSDEQIYQLARMVVAAEIQKVTYDEFLPMLLGPNALARYRGYRPGVNPGIANEFSSAAFRVGHTMVSPRLLRLDDRNAPVAEGPLALRNAFFNPAEIEAGGIDPLLRGLAKQVCQRVDERVVDELRNFLFGPPGAGGLDLASMNIQRARDHGLPPYVGVRRSLRLGAIADFDDINPDPEVARRLASAYGDVRRIDLWVGGLAERHVEGAMVGETIHAILTDQFERLRDGDRFWYESYLPWSVIELVEDATLARIIRRNTGIGRELQDRVFTVSSGSGRRTHR